MGRKRRNRILLSSTRLSIEPLENRALLAGITADIPLSNSLSTDTAQVNTDAILSSTTGFPTNISVEPGDGQVTVHWNSTSQHLHYFVQVSLDDGDTWNTDNVSLSEHPISYTFPLLNDFNYHLRVVESLTPAGQISNTVVVTPRAAVSPQAPGKPTNLLASRSNGFATVTWSNPSDTQSIITSYEIQCSEFTFTEGDGGLWFFKNQSPYSTSTAIVPELYSSLQLRDGVTYLLNIRLRNSSGWGSYSDKVLITPNATEITAPTAPRNLQAEVNNGDVTLSWDAPLSDGGVAITQYEISYRANTDSEWTLLYGTGTSATLPGFTTSGTYEFVVAAQNSAGWSPYSNLATVVIDAPTAPRNLQAEVNNGDVTLSWDAPLSDGGVAITQYEISYRANTDSEWTLLYGTGTSATLPGFINGVTYQFAVSAQNSVGWSEYSSIVTATPSIPINNSPSLNVLNDMLINEDSPGQIVGLTGITVGNDGNQSLRVTSVSSNTGLLPSPIVTYTSPNTTGSLTFTPVANQKGAATITVTVENGGLDDNLSTVGDNKTVQRSFQVTVLEVIASTSSVVLAKDSFQNLYVDTKPVTYNQQPVPQEFFGSTVIDAEMVDSQNFLLLKPLGNQGNQPTHRLLTDNTWRINGIFNALQNESSPILEISGREVSDTLNIATVSGAYDINGVNNPTLIVRRGQTYLFNLNTSGHPFYLQTTGAGYQSANIYIGFSGNGQTSGEHQWVVPEDAPDEIFYQCKFHSVMFGKIVVID
jgi:hypothetical protein